MAEKFEHCSDSDVWLPSGQRLQSIHVLVYFMQIDGMVRGSILKLVHLISSLIEQKPQILLQMLISDLDTQILKIVIVFAKNVVLECGIDQPHFLHLIVALQMGYCALVALDQEGLDSVHKIRHFFALLYKLLSLTWLYPILVNMSDMLNGSLVIIHLECGQSPDEAILLDCSKLIHDEPTKTGQHN